MFIEVACHTITREDYNALKKEFQSEYLELQPDYELALNDQVELILTDEEKADIESKLDLLYLK